MVTRRSNAGQLDVGCGRAFIVAYKRVLRAIDVIVRSRTTMMASSVFPCWSEAELPSCRILFVHGFAARNIFLVLYVKNLNNFLQYKI
jgi:hypothetical protein